MIDISVEQFEALVTDAIDAIPENYGKHISNLGFVVEPEPSEMQRQKLHLVNGMTLYGLYEGVPLPARSGQYSGVLPDKITVFMNPIVASSRDYKDLKDKVFNTVWHEVAHYFGLDHGRIHELERKTRKSK